MARGSCLCGSVRWQTNAPYTGMAHCHCSMCRKAHGAPFATYLCVAPDGLIYEAGTGSIVVYESSPGYRRAFCGHCGSAVPTENDGEVDVPAGCLDDDPGMRPRKHIFTASKAAWHQIGGDLPQLPTFEADGSGPVVVRREPGMSRPGALRGSCLCGGAVYEVTPPFAAVHNCHCSRCRKARAAAHTTNGFAPAQSLRYTNGEALIRRFGLPGAKTFSQSFCTVCGSGMPHAAVTSGMIGIPFGSLDDEPVQGADDHIFVDAKAPWYEIEDDLPQFQQGPPQRGSS